MPASCLLESPIPSETPAPMSAPPGSFSEPYRPARFSQNGPEALVWNPDDVPRARLAVEESVLLDRRGITSQTGSFSARGPQKLAQADIWKSSTIHKNSVSAKLRQVGMAAEADKLELCHSYYTVCECSGCGAIRKFPNRCDLFFCPECAHHLAAERKRQIEWWLPSVKQPKHVVLTVKNIFDLSSPHVAELKRWFSQLRRRKFARNWKGGFYTIEITNEKKGWHLHIHALIDARWISQPELSEQWRSITRGCGHIVHVRDCRGTQFLSEVSKYIVKGSSIAKWTPAQIQTFVHAFEGKRTFGVFGSLYGQRTEFAEYIALLKQGHKQCDCGCHQFNYYSEVDWFLRHSRPEAPQCPRPPPPTHVQVALIDYVPPVRD